MSVDRLRKHSSSEKESELVIYVFDVCPKEITVQRFFIITL
jgi:hypothetical protein